MSSKPGKTPKQSLKPLKTSKPKPNGTPSTKPSQKSSEKQFKSAEFIVDSSDEDDDTAYSQGKPQTKQTDTHNVPKRDVATQPKKKSENELKITNKSSAKAVEIAPSQDFEKKQINSLKHKESVSKSKLSRPQGGKDTNKPTLAKVAKEKASAPRPQSLKEVTSEESGSSEDGSASEEDESESVPTPKNKTAEAVVEERTISSDSGTESSSDSKSESEDDSESDINSENNSSKIVDDRLDDEQVTPRRASTAKRKEIHTSVLRPAQPFDPPLGFKEVAEVSLSTEIGNLFQPSNLSGKQIWYITAPADVPVSIDKVDSNNLAEAKALISHEGQEYTLVNESSSSHSITSIMIPDREGYGTIPSTIAKVMHVQQVARLPSRSSTSNIHVVQDGPDVEYRPTPKRKREQPKGLRMRYKPSGFGVDIPGTIGLGSYDDNDILYTSESLASSTHQPQALAEESSKVKKRREREEEEANEPVRKKSKKEKHHGHENGISSEKKKKKKKDKHTDATTASSTTATPLAMTALQTSNPNGISSASSSSKDGAAKKDDASKEKREKKRHGDKTRDQHSSESKALTRSADSNPRHGDEEKKKKKRKEKMAG